MRTIKFTVSKTFQHLRSPGPSDANLPLWLSITAGDTLHTDLAMMNMAYIGGIRNHPLRDFVYQRYTNIPFVLKESCSGYMAINSAGQEGCKLFLSLIPNRA